MNDPLRMYGLKPVVRHDVAVILPDCMYKLKNIHSSRNGVVAQQPSQVSSKILDISDQNNRSENEMTELEARQDEILKQLAELKLKMSSIRNDLTIPFQQPVSTNETGYVDHQVTFKYKGEIIIKTGPTHPPLSLELIQRLWQKSVNLVVKNHMHSSLKIFDSLASDLWENLENFKPPTKIPETNVRIIWKNLGADLELMVGHTQILGEVNLLRYLVISSEGPLNYEDFPNVNEIDYALDMCFILSKATSQDDRIYCLNFLTECLGTSTWMLNTPNINVLDLAAYSAIQQIFTPDEYSPSIAEWLKRCSNC